MAALVRLGHDRWQVDGVEFVYSYSSESTLECFSLRKPPELVAQVIQLCANHRGETIVELGIAAGGSTAFIALLAQPRRLVACELAEPPVAALAELVALRDLDAVVRPHYGIDQADKAALSKLLDDELGDDPIDLVIDDASHVYAPTLASFEVLYPRLRQGGLFVVEDWAADRLRHKRVVAAIERELARGGDANQRLEAAIAERAAGSPPAPIHRLAAELIQVTRDRNDVVSEVTVDRHWITARRGPADLPRHGFRLAEHHAPDWSWSLP
jgi:predicted O-methyltransferase YrrM